MKKGLFFVLALFAISGAFAQEKIAVFPFEDRGNVFAGDESYMFYQHFSNEFATKNSGRFDVLPRMDVEKLFNMEARFQLSDISARAKTAEMEKALNGRQILSGVIGKVGSSYSIIISLYTFPEMVQLPGGATLRFRNTDELFDKIPELVQTMYNNMTANLPPAPAYKIGDRGPGGGVIFVAEGGVYMECSMDIGSYNWNDAVRAAGNYKGGGLTDWRLPTQGELDLMYRNLKQKGLGGFGNSYYWSSGHPTLSGGRGAWSQNFKDGEQRGWLGGGSYDDNTKQSYSVRAVRAF